MNAEEKFSNFLKDKLSDADFRTAWKLYAEIFDELTATTGQMFEQASESLKNTGVKKRGSIILNLSRLVKWKSGKKNSRK